MVREIVLTAGSMVLIGALAVPAMAQNADPAQTTPAAAPPASPGRHSLTISGSAGYLFTRTLGTDDTTLPLGWAASIDVTFDGRYAGVVEFTGARQSGDAADVPGARQLSGITAGGRFYFGKYGVVRPFAQLLVGQTRVVADGDRFLTWQPGGGVDIPVAPHVGVRLQADWASIRQPNDPLSSFRFVAGVLIR